jgi:molybdopterin guanine dinucleotide-containing S/N-oxide reductase-like protein
MAEQVFVNCANGGPVRVHVENGKVRRIRPLVLDDSDAPSWTMEARGMKFTPMRKVCLPGYVVSERDRLYAEDRIRYPMKRVDFDPNGDRHTENRGKSGYVRISWDEALDIVGNEMKRIRAKYGPEAIMSRCSSHHNWGNLGYRSSAWARFFSLIGFTDILDNPDSWEGWHWGSSHAYGFYWRLGIPEQYNLLEDGLKNTELIIHWGNDPDSTHGVYSGNESAQWRLWLRDLGVKQIFIDPFCNYTAVLFGDKWIAPRPGTDAAMAEAIAYTWIKEGTYDKEYVKTHTVGFDDFKEQVMGKNDGTPRTPEWAEEKSGVPARVIKAIAHEWASKRTALACGTRGGESGACREAYGTEWARLMVLLQAMQGLGKPGVSIWGTAMGSPINPALDFPGYAVGGLQYCADKPAINQVKQRLWRLTVPDAILNPPVNWRGEGFCGSSLEQQFTPFKYPWPGCSEVKMFYRYGGSFLSTMVDTSKWVRMYQSPKLEFVVNQDVWFCNETKFADVILPACTQLERNDISMWANPGGYSHHGYAECNHCIIVYQQKCIEPLHESKPDMWILTQLARRLGVEQEYTEGRTEDEWIKKFFDKTDLGKWISFEEFKTKGYYVIPLPDKPNPTALRWFYEGRDCDTPDKFNPKIGTAKAKELGTYSGKIEFVSQSLLQNLPDDDERPPLPRYIPSWEGHESKEFQKYPVQLISPHPRCTFHTHQDNHSMWLSEIPQHRILKDGYYWHVVQIHPDDAEPKGIKNNDIVKIYNDRATVLGIAHLTERIRRGVIHSYEGSSQYDPINPGDPMSPDRGGCVNLLTPSRMLSKNVPGMAPNSCLVDFALWEG